MLQCYVSVLVWLLNSNECLSLNSAVFFDAMSFHTASPVSNGIPRYVLTTAMHDERAIDLPHKLYQRSFSVEFISALAPTLRKLVGWLPQFVAEHLEGVGGRSTQFWVYGARRHSGAGAGAGEGVARL